MSDATPLVTYHRLIETARLPERADRSACGLIPARAARYCDALTQASAFGHYVFPPMELSLLWDGEQIFWTYSGTDRWLPLDAAQFPGFSRDFDAAAPEGLQGCAPPFLTALPEPGTLQLWTGLFARTAPGWSLLLRPLANIPPPAGLSLFEGVVETDRWFGPLFTNLRLTRTNAPVRLRADWPLLQAQLIPQAVLADATQNNVATTADIAAFTPREWEDYRTSIVAPNTRPNRPLGATAVANRRRRRADAAAHG
jgi:hypothetical protein